MTAFEMTEPFNRTLRHPRRRRRPDDDPAMSFDRVSTPTNESVDPDFDAFDVDGLLHDLEIVPAPSIGDDGC